MSDQPPVEDDPGITDDIVLLRPFSPKVVSKTVDGQPVISSGAFQEIEDEVTGEKAMSAYRADIMESLGLTYEAIVEQHPSLPLIVSVPVHAIRAEELGVIPAAVAEEGPVGQAHVHVNGKFTRPKRRHLADKAEWVRGPELPDTPESSA